MGMMRDEYHYLVGTLGFRELALEQYLPSGVRITGLELSSRRRLNRTVSTVPSEQGANYQQQHQSQFGSILNADSDSAQVRIIFSPILSAVLYEYTAPSRCIVLMLKNKYF